MMLFVSEPFKDNLILTYFAGVVGATLLELVTGAAMEALLKVRYWDYSNQKFNYKGYICLSSSIAWGFLTILMNEVFHPAILHVLAIIPKMADEIFVWVVSAGLAVDLCISVRDAIDLRNILVGMENVRKEVVSFWCGDWFSHVTNRLGSIGNRHAYCNRCYIGDTLG